uniref:Uncharacterized protein n=1 Tax=Mycena chlorophos TaxID=658473 RepID=A0ABQ0LWS1_MYCCL|nr:predicted protein [Mycena chlorophos]
MVPAAPVWGKGKIPRYRLGKLDSQGTLAWFEDGKAKLDLKSESQRFWFDRKNRRWLCFKQPQPRWNGVVDEAQFGHPAPLYFVFTRDPSKDNKFVPDIPTDWVYRDAQSVAPAQVGSRRPPATS